MKKQGSYDAVVVGSGPNGLAAAITLAQAGWSVLVMEANATIGGGARSAALTIPDFVHDVCSAVYPLGIGSPFFKELPLGNYGLEWIHPPIALAHPFDDGSAVTLERSVAATAASLGLDGKAYPRLLSGFVRRWDAFAELALTMRPSLASAPSAFWFFVSGGLGSARGLAERWFDEEKTRAMMAGVAAHSGLPLDKAPSAAFSLVLCAAAHAVGWPIVRGGAQRLAESLAKHFQSLGGEVVTECPVSSLSSLPPARVTLLDVTPRQLLQIAGGPLPKGWQRRIDSFRYGVAAFKMDWALHSPIPWQAEKCRGAGTVHLGGTLEEISESENAANHGEVPTRPFVLVCQPSLFDSSRAPADKHTAWAYCHVPRSCTLDMSEAIEAKIERFAPGFRDCILARSVMSPAKLESYNPNYIGGDILGGQPGMRSLLRPLSYRTPLRGVYLCSSSTPPGAGVHGMCGWLAARRVLKDFKLRLGTISSE